MKKVIYISKISLIAILLSLVSCNNWLDIEPVGVQTSDSYWETKEEVEQVLSSAYVGLRDCMPLFFKWGELRTNELDFGMAHSTSSDKETQDERSLRTLDIKSTSVFTRWANVYTVIGRANSVIHFAKNALKTDITFTPELANSYIAEAVFLRSLCYFYLVRTFRDVPYIKDVYADDSKTFTIPKTDGNEILVDVIKDLEENVTKCKPGYEVEWQTKGRATSWGFYALMADIYLWQERYPEVRNIYKILKNAGFKLVSTKSYWELFYPGNSKEESIFELQYRGNLPNQSNSLYYWFNSSVNDGRYIISENSKNLFEKEEVEEDIRGKGYTYDTRYIGEKYWKYIGTESRKDQIYPDSKERPKDQRSPNWIFYRFADIVLMEAEAMTMTNVPLNQVAGFIDTTIRKRAGYTKPLLVPSTKEEMLGLILKERQKEFLAEGKKWFDVLRMSRKENYSYRGFLEETLLFYVSVKDRSTWKIRLKNEYSHYLPINKSEIENSRGVLKQNPFYEGVE